MRGKGSHAGLVRVRPELRNMITFKSLNLLAGSWPVSRPFDVIFCRNVMIYFDKPTQSKILSRFAPLMKADGLLFAGHSENFLHVSDAFTLARQDGVRIESPSSGGKPEGWVMNPAIEEQLATNLYYDQDFGCEAAKILPGEYYFTNKPMLIVTVLGSCVAACIRDRVSGIGGMNHFMLPDAGSEDGSPSSASMRYGAYAMEVLINQLLKAGARRENLDAKVFGGGNVLRGFTAINVGERNAQFVRELLACRKNPDHCGGPE